MRDFVILLKAHWLSLIVIWLCCYAFIRQHARRAERSRFQDLPKRRG